MMTTLEPPAKEIDVDFLVFVERYATDLLKWDILTFFAQHPNMIVTANELAQDVKRNIHTIRQELGDLVLVGILQQSTHTNEECTYRLSERSPLRRDALKLANVIPQR